MTAPLSQRSTAQLGRVARGGALNLVGAVFSAVTGFLLIVVVANRTDAQDAGALFAATSLALILVSVATLGTETGLARFLLPLESKRRYGDVLATIRSAVGPVAATSIGLSLVLAVGAPWLAPLVGLSGRQGASLIRLIAIALPFAVVADVALSATRAFGAMRPTVVIDNLGRTMLQLVLVALAARWGADAAGLTLASFIPYVVAAVAAGVVISRTLAERRRRWTGPVWTGPVVASSTMPREFWTYTWPRAIARITQIAVQRLDIVLVAVLIDAAAAAVYTAATRFVVFGQLAGQAMYRVLQPRFSSLLDQGEHETVKDVFRVSTAWTMATSWPIYVGVGCGAPLYLRLFGSGYGGDAVPVVVLMAVAMMFAMAAGPLDTLLLMAGHSKVSLGIAVITLVTDVGLCLVLIPRIGIVGAAAAWAIAVVVKNALSYWQVHRATGLTPLSIGGAIVGAANIGCLALPLLTVGFLTDFAVLPFTLTVVIGGACYVGVLWLGRGPLALASVVQAFRRPTRGKGATA